MADMMDTLRGLLGEDADQKINSVMSALGGAGSSDTQSVDSPQPDTEPPQSPAITPELLVQAQGLIRQLSSPEGDNRAYLLQSLKPYVRDSRKNSIDTAIKLLNITRLSKLFKGGLSF